jgi:hypothetical protein
MNTDQEAWEECGVACHPRDSGNPSLLLFWIPAFAGMTEIGLFLYLRLSAFICGLFWTRN